MLNPVRDPPLLSVNYLNAETQQFAKPFENQWVSFNPLGSVLLAWFEGVRHNVDSWSPKRPSFPHLPVKLHVSMQTVGYKSRVQPVLVRIFVIPIPCVVGNATPQIS